MESKVTVRNAFCIVVILLISANFITGLPANLGQGTWISILLSLIPIFPLLVIYARINKLMPQKNLFEVAECVFGKAVSRCMALLYTVYALVIAAFFVNRFAFFIHLTSLYKTPLLVISLVLLIPAVYLAKSGVRTIGKYSFLVFMVLVFGAIFLLFGSLRYMEFEKLLPVFEGTVADVISETFGFVSYPFGAVVVLLILFSFSERTERVYIGGVIAAVLFTAVITVAIVCMMGLNTVENSLFPVYKSVSIIRIGRFIQRFESMFAFIVILTGIIKISVYLLSASKGAMMVFKGSRVRLSVVLALAGVAVMLSVVLFDGNTKVFEVFKLYNVWAIPFYAGVPVLLWVGAEVRARRLVL